MHINGFAQVSIQNGGLGSYEMEREPWERGCHLPGALGDVIAVICAAATSLTSLIGIDIFGTIGILCSSNCR